jgi:formylglycine-generating enzyme required for sulfatase activity
MNHLRIFTLVLFSSILLIAASSKKGPVKAPKNFVYIPEGVTYYNNNQFKVDGFYMYKYEISNAEYKYFLEQIKDYDDAEIQRIIQVENESWKKALNKPDAFINHYFSDKKYNKYPVVNIHKRAADIYCKWFTKVYNEKHKTNYTFTLPTKLQFIRAAKGDEYNNVYAWGNNEAKDEKGRLLGNFLYESTTFDENSESVTAPVKSYQKNQFGLYNMSGNVAEWIKDEDIAMGGSWNCLANHAKAESFFNNGTAHPKVGFRMVMTINEESKK